MESHECKKEQEIHDLKGEIKQMRQELHEGDLKFMEIGSHLKSLTESVDNMTKALSDALQHIQTNENAMKALKWVGIGFIASMLISEIGFVEFLKGLF